MKKITQFLATLILVTMAANSYAWTSTYVDSWNRYVIMCNDGTTHTYSGGAEGLGLVGDALCKLHQGAAPPRPVRVEFLVAEELPVTGASFLQVID